MDQSDRVSWFNRLFNIYVHPWHAPRPPHPVLGRRLALDVQQQGQGVRSADRLDGDLGLKWMQNQGLDERLTKTQLNRWMDELLTWPTHPPTHPPTSPVRGSSVSIVSALIPRSTRSAGQPGVTGSPAPATTLPAARRLAAAHPHRETCFRGGRSPSGPSKSGMPAPGGMGVADLGAPIILGVAHQRDAAVERHAARGEQRKVFLPSVISVHHLPRHIPRRRVAVVRWGAPGFGCRDRKGRRARPARR